MKNIKLFFILITLTSIACARPIFDRLDLLGIWSSENTKWGNITLEIHEFNTPISDRLNMYFTGEPGSRMSAFISTGYYGSYSLNVIADEGILSFNGLCVFNFFISGTDFDFIGRIFLAKEASLEELKENSLQSDLSRSFLPENMKALIRLDKEENTGKLIIIWEDLDYYLHHRRVFFGGNNFENIKQQYISTELGVSESSKENNSRLILRKSEL